MHDEEHNRAIVYEIRCAVQHGLPSMILVGCTEHGKILTEMLKQAGLRCDFIKRENDPRERKAALNALKDRRIDSIIGTTILHVGADVPAVGTIVLAGRGGKAEVRTRQRVGRGLRTKKSGPMSFSCSTF